MLKTLSVLGKKYHLVHLRDQFIKHSLLQSFLISTFDLNQTCKIVHAENCYVWNLSSTHFVYLSIMLEIFLPNLNFEGRDLTLVTRFCYYFLRFYILNCLANREVTRCTENELFHKVFKSEIFQIFHDSYFEERH